MRETNRYDALYKMKYDMKWQEVEIGYMSCEAYSSEKVGMAMKGLIRLRRKKWQEVEIKKARKLTFRNDCMKL